MRPSFPFKDKGLLAAMALLMRRGFRGRCCRCGRGG